jgi:hypothetical protein
LSQIKRAVLTSIKRILWHWLPLATITVALGGMVYLAIQQVLRLGGNEPQVQMAEDAAAALVGGEPPQMVLPSGKVDLASSLAPFMIVYDETGAVMAASGYLAGQVPSLPPGVLDYTRSHGEDRVTWQPAPGVRIAAVIIHHGGAQSGFVLAGRSLREVERRIDLLNLQVAAGLLAALGASLVVVILVEVILKPNR